MSRFPHDAKVYVGDLGSNASKQEIEDAFGYYGPLRSVWVARNPPGFAFVEFEDARDAEDSVRGLDGRTICGRRARVELSTGKSARGHGGRSRRRSRGREDRCYECGNRGHFARDCRRRGRRRSRSRSRSREYRTRSRSYSRSPRRSNTKRSPRHGDSRGISKSPRMRDSRSKSKSVDRSKSRSVGNRSPSRDSRSPSRNGDD